MNTAQEKWYVFYDKENMVKGLTTISGKDEVVANEEITSVEVTEKEFKQIKKLFSQGYRTIYTGGEEIKVATNELDIIKEQMVTYLNNCRRKVDKLIIEVEIKDKAIRVRMDKEQVYYLQLCIERNNSAIIELESGKFIQIPDESVENIVKAYEKAFTLTYHNTLAMLKATQQAKTLVELEKLLSHLGYSTINKFLDGVEFKET